MGSLRRNAQRDKDSNRALYEQQEFSGDIAIAHGLGHRGFKEGVIEACPDEISKKVKPHTQAASKSRPNMHAAPSC